MIKDKFKMKSILTLSVSLIIIVFILLFVFPGFLNDSYNMKPLNNQKSSLRNRNSLVERLSERDKTLEIAFKKNFVKPFLNGMKESGFEGVIRAIELDNRENKSQDVTFLLDDQLLWGKYLVLTKQEKAFEHWQKMLDTYYRFQDSWTTSLDQNGKALSTTRIMWPYDLKYAEVLLLSYNQNPSQQSLNRIEQIMAKLKPLFVENKLPANTKLEVERIFYPETSSSSKPVENPALLDPYTKQDFISLADINLYVLESFSLLDKSWQEPFEQWLNIFVEAMQESKDVFFYPLGITDDLQHYIATGERAFHAATWDNVRILCQSSNNLENPALSGFYKRQILQSTGLDKVYHNVSLQRLSGELDIAATALFSEYIYQSQDIPSAEISQLEEAVKSSLNVQCYTNQFNDLNNLYFEKTQDGKLLFYAKNQIAVLNSGLFE